MNLHEFYFGVWTTARHYQWRIGQALFNNLAELRPELAEHIRGSAIDPFYASIPTDERYDGAIKYIEANWFNTPLVGENIDMAEDWL
jgi:hypothetical protein